jgi:hypothetical protein
MLNNEFIINPSRKQLEKSPLNLVLSVGKNKNIRKNKLYLRTIHCKNEASAIECLLQFY